MTLINFYIYLMKLTNLKDIKKKGARRKPRKVKNMKKYIINIYYQREKYQDGSKILKEKHQTDNAEKMLKRLSSGRDFYYIENDIEIIENFK